MREWIIETAFSIYHSLTPILGIAFGVIFFVLIPLGLFDKTRGFSANALYIISYIFGFAIWVYSAGVAFALLGWFWLIVGLLLAGLGVILVAFLGALFLGYFGLAFGIALSAIFPLIIRYIAIYLTEKDEAQNRKTV
jgi:hypothetical protein